MKILALCISKNRPKTFANTTLKYISRAGYDYRIYVPRKQRSKYQEAIKEAVQKHYLYVPEGSVKTLPVRIPKKYQLALYVPDNLKGCNDNKLLEFCRYVGALRSEMGGGKEADKKGPFSGLNMVKLS